MFIISYPAYFSDASFFMKLQDEGKTLDDLPDFEDIHYDVYNSNRDVFVTDETGYTYILTVATPQNLECLMDENGMNYWDGHPMIIVKKLTKEIIAEAIRAYAELNDAYWLKFYHFCDRIDRLDLDQLPAKYMKKNNFENLIS